MTQAQMLLDAVRIESKQRELGEMTEEDLTVIAYKHYRDAFCMRGYPLHPDRKKVSLLLCTGDFGQTLERSAPGKWIFKDKSK